MERYYYLPDNKSEASPGNVIFFDTESHFDASTSYETGQYHRLRLGVAIAGRIEKGKLTREKRCRFTTQQQFWDFVSERSHPKIPTWLFAHNIGYDLLTTGFPERLVDDTFRLFDRKKPTEKTDILGQKFSRTDGFICTENPPVIISVRHKEGWKLIAIDTFNFWVTSLEKLGKLVGQQKGEMPAYAASDADWFAYCEQDVEVIKTAVLGLVEWVKKNNLGKFRFTAPSQAMAAFRHRFYPTKIVLHNNLVVRNFEREGYYGGRLECFFQGTTNEKTYELDVSSLYPSVMQGNVFPTRMAKWQHPLTHTHVSEPDLDGSYLATVKLKTLEAFPKRLNKTGTIYPVGEYWTTLCGPELIRAKQQNVVRGVRAWIRFDLAEIFSPFVEFFWSYRKEQTEKGNKLNADLAKLMMNSLYGKFGQKSNAWKDRPDMIINPSLSVWTEPDGSTGNTELFRSIGQCVQQWIGKQEHPYAFPSIAAYVTSYARERMLSLKKIAGNKNVYYLVTDALFVNQAGYDNLQQAEQLSETEMGYLRVKHGAESATFEALHHYQIGDHVVEGSRKKSARKQSDGSFIELHFESLDKALKRKPDSSVHVQPRTKRYVKEYTRGIIGQDGWIEPLTLFEE